MATRPPDPAKARVLWMALPALLAAASQFGSIALVSRWGGVGAVLLLQSMMSLWAWNGVVALGWDKAARGLALPGVPLGAYAHGWRRRLAVNGVLGALLGAAAGASWGGGVGAWSAFGVALGVCGMGWAAREWLFAQGRLADVGQALCAGFVLGAAATGALAWAQAPGGWVCVAWFLPHAAIWMFMCARMGLFRATPARDGGHEGDAPVADARSQPQVAYGLQAAGHVALVSFDVVIARQLLLPADAYVYVVYSRLAFAAFIVSVTFGAHFIRQAIRSGPAGWARSFWPCAGVHGGFAACAVSVLAVAGPWITRIWLGGHGLGLPAADLALLAVGCAGRALCESAMQTLSGAPLQRVALSSFAGAALGLAVFWACLAFGLCRPMAALALAWFIPGATLVACATWRRRPRTPVGANRPA